MSDIPTLDPGPTDPIEEETTDGTPEQQDSDTARILVPRTATTARAWLAERAEANRILALPAVREVRAALSRYTCLSCGDVLPAGRGGHCDACVEWGD